MPKLTHNHRPQTAPSNMPESIFQKMLKKIRQQMPAKILDKRLKLVPNFIWIFVFLVAFECLEVRLSRRITIFTAVAGLLISHLVDEPLSRPLLLPYLVMAIVGIVPLLTGNPEYVVLNGCIISLVAVRLCDTNTPEKGLQKHGEKRLNLILQLVLLVAFTLAFEYLNIPLATGIIIVASISCVLICYLLKQPFSVPLLLAYSAMTLVGIMMLRTGDPGYIKMTHVAIVMIFVTVIDLLRAKE